MFIVELQKGVWLAPWQGDPGRTLKKESALKFFTRRGAMKALKKAQELRPFKRGMVIDTNI